MNRKSDITSAKGSAKMQLTLQGKDAFAENPGYLTHQLITYIGNKRALLGEIGRALDEVKRKTGKERLRVFDVFSGSGVVSRYFKAHSSMLASNDFEDYAAVIGRCYLRNSSVVDTEQLEDLVRQLNQRVISERLPMGFIEELYAPRCDNNITKNDRVFYTRENARRLDSYRHMIGELPDELQDLLIAPLLSKASVHSNTAGVFKGFYKNRETKLGQFGGTGSDALQRIKGQILLEPPLFSRFECDYIVFQEDANRIAGELKGLDLAYIDPPYNQHPYGSNYFMLNLLVHYKRPLQMSHVSGIPNDWRRSGYNVRQNALPLLEDLLHTLDTRFLLVSFNNEGFISPDKMMRLLTSLGEVKVREIRYNTFRGSRNLNGRKIHVTEQLYLVDRKRC